MTLDAETRVAITGAGGAAAIGFTRSLAEAGRGYVTIGLEASRFGLARAVSDERALVPVAAAPEYLDVLSTILERARVDLLYVQTDYEMPVISEHRDRLPARTFLPAHETVLRLQDKYASYLAWRDAGVATPRTMMLRAPEDVHRAIADFGPRIWIREIVGGAGLNSLPTGSADEGIAWVERHDGWGDRFSAAELLSPRTVTWQSIWYEGELIVAQGRERLYWEFGSRAPSGVTGITGAGVTVADDALDDLAMRAVRAVDARPHGIFGVDMTYGFDGAPRVTEINVGRFFTTHHFFTRAGLNLPDIYARLALTGESGPIAARLNPLPPGLVWIRGMDVDPVLTTMDALDALAVGQPVPAPAAWHGRGA